MTEAEAQEYAMEWIASWNSHDLDRILNHYADDVEVVSPLVETVLGPGRVSVRGKAQLREYWGTALAKYPDLHFRPLSRLRRRPAASCFTTRACRPWSAPSASSSTGRPRAPRARPLCSRAGPRRRLSCSSAIWPAPPCTTGERFPPRSPRRSRRPGWRSIRPRSLAGVARPSARSSPGCSAASAGGSPLGVTLPQSTVVSGPCWRPGSDRRDRCPCPACARHSSAFERRGLRASRSPPGSTGGSSETILAAVEWAHLLDGWGLRYVVMLA